VAADSGRHRAGLSDPPNVFAVTGAESRRDQVPLPTVSGYPVHHRRDVPHRIAYSGRVCSRRRSGPSALRLAWSVRLVLNVRRLRAGSRSTYSRLPRDFRLGGSGGPRRDPSTPRATLELVDGAGGRRIDPSRSAGAWPSLPRRLQVARQLRGAGRQVSAGAELIAGPRTPPWNTGRAPTCALRQHQLTLSVRSNSFNAAWLLCLLRGTSSFRAMIYTPT